MGEDERKEEAEKARQAKEDRDSGQVQQQQQGNLAAAVTRRPSLQNNKGWHCPTCGTGFTTKGNMFKHIRTFHEAQGQDGHTLPRASLEEEPVTFETFKKYFDRDAVERDPQDFFPPSTSSAGSGKGNTKTRFTAHQRVVLLENFHK